MESEIEEESMMMEEELEGSIMSNKYLEYLDYDDEEAAKGYFVGVPMLMEAFIIVSLSPIATRISPPKSELGL